MSLADWLYMHQHMKASTELRGLWRDLVFTYGLGRDNQSYRACYSPYHDLTAADMECLLYRLDRQARVQENVLATLISGAEPEQLVQLLTHPGDSSFLTEVSTGSIIGSPKVLHAVNTNPRMLDKHYHQLEDASVINPWSLVYLSDAYARRNKMDRFATYDRTLDRIFTELVKALGSDHTGWNLFFTVWGGAPSSGLCAQDRETELEKSLTLVETVRASL